jgi:hypothetical protein
MLGMGLTLAVQVSVIDQQKVVHSVATGAKAG